MSFIPRFLGDRIMAFVTGVITKFVGLQMNAGVNMWTAYRNLKITGLAAPYTAFADTWAQLYKQRVFSHKLGRTWFTGMIPQGLMSERVLKQPYKYLYTYDLHLRDKDTGKMWWTKTSYYSNQHLSRENAMTDMIGKMYADRDKCNERAYTIYTGKLILAEHNIAMEW